MAFEKYHDWRISLLPSLIESMSVNVSDTTPGSKHTTPQCYGDFGRTRRT